MPCGLVTSKENLISTPSGFISAEFSSVDPSDVQREIDRKFYRDVLAETPVPVSCPQNCPISQVVIRVEKRTVRMAARYGDQTIPPLTSNYSGGVVHGAFLGYDYSARIEYAIGVYCIPEGAVMIPDGPTGVVGPEPDPGDAPRPGAVCGLLRANGAFVEGMSSKVPVAAVGGPSAVQVAIATAQAEAAASARALAWAGILAEANGVSCPSQCKRKVISYHISDPAPDPPESRMNPDGSFSLQVTSSVSYVVDVFCLPDGTGLRVLEKSGSSAGGNQGR